MKGFPRRGSDLAGRSRRHRHTARLNEGLPQKGKRSGAGGVGVHDGGAASMKGFPRRGSDTTDPAGSTDPSNRPQ